jgi:hypothetical protein
MVKTLPRDVVDTIQKLGFEWETYVDEDEEQEYLFARGSVDNIKILVTCRPTECKVEAPDYIVPPCYTKPAPDVTKCVHIVVSRVKEAEKAINDLMQIAEKTARHGFKITRSNRSNSIIAYKSIDGGEVEIVLNSKSSGVLRMEVKGSPDKLVLIAVELSELLSKLQL